MLLFLENSCLCGSYVSRLSCLPSQQAGGKSEMDRCKVEKAAGTNKQPNKSKEAGLNLGSVKIGFVCSC